VSVLGGRAGVPRSLGSVYAGSVTRFLGPSFRGDVVGVVVTAGSVSSLNGIACCRCGLHVLVGDRSSLARGVTLFGVRDDTSRMLVSGRFGQVFVAADGCIFATDATGHRVVVLCPDGEAHSTTGDSVLCEPVGVVADAAVVVVSEPQRQRLTVLGRDGYPVIRRCLLPASYACLYALCFVDDGAHVAATDAHHNRVVVVDLHGVLLRVVGDGVLRGPSGVACLPWTNALVVADADDKCLLLFSSAGVVLKRFCHGVACSGVSALGDAAVFAQDCHGQQCIKCV
jgi:hypothetical protein